MDPRWSFNRALLAGALVAQLFAILVYGQFNPRVFASLEMLVLAPALLLVGALLLWRARPWTYLAAAGASLILPVVLLLAAALAIPAGVSGARRAARGLPSLTFRERARTNVGLGMAAIVGVAAGALGAGLLAAAHAPEEALPFDIVHERSVDVAARDFAYDPVEVPLQAGVPTEVRARNEDVAIHTFTYAVGGVVFDHELPAGATTSFVVLLDEPGTVPYWCVLHTSADRTKGMVGEIVVSG